MNLMKKFWYIKKKLNSRIFNIKEKIYLQVDVSWISSVLKVNSITTQYWENVQLVEMISSKIIATFTIIVFRASFLLLSVLINFMLI